MRRVVIESPLSGDRVRNKRYARLCERDCLDRGEAPYASHLLYDDPDVLDDTDDAERKRGMEAGFEWGKCAEACVVYTDLSITAGMRAGIQRAEDNEIPVEYRQLPSSMMASLDAKLLPSPERLRELQRLIEGLGITFASRRALRIVAQYVVEGLR